jgi:copper chaperone CopZ
MDETCHVEAIQKIVTVEEQQATALIRLVVHGMGCPNCAARVRNGLLALNGVTEADVEFNPNLVAVPALLQAVAQAGNDGRHRYHAFSLSDAIA